MHQHGLKHLGSGHAGLRKNRLTPLGVTMPYRADSRAGLMARRPVTGFARVQPDMIGFQKVEWPQ